MVTSKNGINLIKQFEGLRLSAYRCSAGVWTIGYGSTSGVRPGMKITQAEAEQRLRADLSRFEQKLNKLVKVRLNQNEFDALVSFVFNIGITAFSNSTLLRLLNQGQARVDVADQLLRWDKVNGQPVVGLTRRRAAERRLFLS